MLGFVWDDEEDEGVFIKEEDKDPNIDYMSEEEVKALYQWIRVKFY